MIENDPLSEAINRATDNLIKIMDGTTGECHTRCPNEWEQREYLIRRLRAICKYNEELKDSLSTQRFRSIRGQIRHGHLDDAFNFFKKHGEDYIKKEFEDYCKSECIINISMPIVFPEPVTVYTIELNIKNEEETSNGT